MPKPSNTRTVPTEREWRELRRSFAPAGQALAVSTNDGFVRFLFDDIERCRYILNRKFAGRMKRFALSADTSTGVRALSFPAQSFDEAARSLAYNGVRVVCLSPNAGGGFAKTGEIS